MGNGGMATGWGSVLCVRGCSGLKLSGGALVKCGPTWSRGAGLWFAGASLKNVFTDLHDALRVDWATLVAGGGREVCCGIKVALYCRNCTMKTTKVSRDVSVELPLSLVVRRSKT